MGPIFTGEVRLVELSFANDPAIVAGATLSSAPAITILEKRGETAVSGVVLTTTTTPAAPANPAIVGSGVRFWALAPAAGRYLVRGTAVGSNGETLKARDVLLVE